MRLSDPVDIMLDPCIPNKKKLMRELSRLTHGEVLQVKIDDCVTTRSLVESYVKNKWCRIVKVVEKEDTNILHIELDVAHDPSA